MNYTASEAELFRKYDLKHRHLSNKKLAEVIVKEEGLPESHNTMRKKISFFRADKAKQNVDFDFEQKEDFELVRTMYEERKPFVLPKSCNDILFINDIHIPFHDYYALKTTLKYGKDRGVNTIYINGDLIDFYAISRFVRDPNKRDVAIELDYGKQFLRQLRNLFPQAKIYFKLGNHEMRWSTYKQTKADELCNLEELKLQNILKLSEFGVELIDEFTITKIGKLFAIHGHEMPGFGINISRNKRLKALDNIIFGHHHFTQDDFGRSIGDQIIGSFAVGALCGLSPDYMPINNWNLGFAHIQVENDGAFEVQNKKIINGTIK
jgi:predicted phosphodiesterase